MKEHHGTAAKLALLALGIALTQGAAHPAAGQTQAPQQAAEKPLQHEVSVVLKLIHVYVTDKKGNPVPDLAKGDFIVMDNGQPVTVTEFERRVLQAAPAKVPAEAPLPPPTHNVDAVPVIGKDENRKFFLYFDFAYNNPRGITKARKAALHFLDTNVAPGDEIALVSYSMLRGFAVHEYLTTDRAKVKKAIEEVGQKEIVGRADEVEEQYWQQATEGLRTSEASQGANLGSQEVRETNIKRWESKQIAERFLQGMTTLAKALRAVPGKKQFILFSSGIPASLLYGNQAGTPMGNPDRTTGQFRIGEGVLFETGDPLLRSHAEEMNREFAASGCSFFVFDTRESAMKTSMFERDSQTLESGQRAFSPTSAFETNSMYKNNRITGLETLTQLAKATGGEYFSNIDRYEKNFDLVQALTGSFYVIGYPVSERWDGKYHEVKVEVTRKGCEVRAQAGYFNPKPFSEYTGLEKQLHLFDLALNERAFSRLPISVPMTALTSAAEGITRLAILAKIPTEVMTKMTGRQIEFVSIFFDESGEISDVVREETDLAALRDRELAFAAGTALKPGSYSCRLVIRDMDTGQSAVASTKATVVKPQFTGLQLGTPLLLETRTGCVFLDAHSKKGQNPIAWPELYPFDSAHFAPVLAGQIAGTTSLRVVIPCAMAAGGQPDLAITANMINAKTGELAPLSLLSLDEVSRGPFKVLTLDISSVGAPAGTYYVHFHFSEKRTGALGHAVSTIVLGDYR